jgi:hypothetical protein
MVTIIHSTRSVYGSFQILCLIANAKALLEMQRYASTHK